MSLKSQLLGSSSVGPGPLVPTLGGPPANPTFFGSIEIMSDHDPLGLTERGLVISPPINLERGRFYLKSSDIDPLQLRANLLLWDRLAFPNNNFISIGEGPDAKFLMAEGILFRPQARISGGGNAAIAFLKAHLESFSFLDRKEPGRWSLARGEDSISFPEEQMEKQRGLLLQFYDAIPIPDREVPIEAVLEFRARRRAELLSLRHHIDNIYLEVLASPDKDLAAISALTAFDKSLSDHIRASQEAPFRMRLSGLDIKFDWKTVGVGIASHAGAVAAGLPLASALLATGGLTALSMLSVTAGIKGRERSNSPFEYVARFNKELL